MQHAYFFIDFFITFPAARGQGKLHTYLVAMCAIIAGAFIAAMQLSLSAHKE